jgi:hypothetical protein
VIINGKHDNSEPSVRTSVIIPNRQHFDTSHRKHDGGNNDSHNNENNNSHNSPNNTRHDRGNNDSHNSENNNYDRAKECANFSSATGPLCESAPIQDAK